MGRLDFISYLHLSKSNLISVNESTAPQIFYQEVVLPINIFKKLSSQFEKCKTRCDKSRISLTDLVNLI